MKLSNDSLKVVKQTKKYALCKCPFHNDSHASAVIYFDTQTFTCFVCHITKKITDIVDGGLDSIERFVMPDLTEEPLRYSKPTGEALRYLAERKIDVDKLPDFVVSPALNNGVGFLFTTMQGRSTGMQVRLFPDFVHSKAIRYINYGKKQPFFGHYVGFMSGKYTKLAVFEKAFGALRAQQVSEKNKLGIACLSSAGSNIDRNLFPLVGLNTVFFLDNDSAGRRAAKGVAERGFKVIIPGNPVDEMPLEALTEMLQKVFRV